MQTKLIRGGGRPPLPPPRTKKPYRYNRWGNKTVRRQSVRRAAPGVAQRHAARQAAQREQCTLRECAHPLVLGPARAAPALARVRLLRHIPLLGICAREIIHIKHTIIRNLQIKHYIIGMYAKYPYFYR